MMSHRSRNLVIIGVSSNFDLVELACEIRESDGSHRYSIAGFLDDDPRKQGQFFRGHPVLGVIDSANGCPGDFFFVNAIGNVKGVASRDRIVERAGVPEERFATLVHPRAHVSASSRLGPGAVVLAGATIGSDAQLDGFCDVMHNAIVSHGCSIGKFAFLAAGAALGGGVVVGECTFIGLNASVREGVRIGKRAIVGQGAVVIHDVPDNTTVAGSPARIIHPTRTHDEAT